MDPQNSSLSDRVRFLSFRQNYKKQEDEVTRLLISCLAAASPRLTWFCLSNLVGASLPDSFQGFSFDVQPGEDTQKQVRGAKKRIVLGLSITDTLVGEDLESDRSGNPDAAIVAKDGSVAVAIETKLKGPLGRDQLARHVEWACAQGPPILRPWGKVKTMLAEYEAANPGTADGVLARECGLFIQMEVLHMITDPLRDEEIQVLRTGDSRNLVLWSRAYTKLIHLLAEWSKRYGKKGLDFYYSRDGGVEIWPLDFRAGWPSAQDGLVGESDVLVRVREDGTVQFNWECYDGVIGILSQAEALEAHRGRYTEEWRVPPEVKRKEDWRIGMSLFPVLERKSAASLEDQVELIHTALMEQVAFLTPDIGELPQVGPFTEVKSS